MCGTELTIFIPNKAEAGTEHFRKTVPRFNMNLK
jgi:hypothetical protein